MVPTRHAYKLWDDLARRWHGKKLDGCKAGLWALSWRGQGQEDCKIFLVLEAVGTKGWPCARHVHWPSRFKYW
ncbi:hypothetical protein HAX54_025102 [Datura stramonium]|uniref:Uncharacterized protein n=1 Tax=Datura stramonium TaxID=4076 RepID=A0ABS8V101_DATST|nr:hypothetical protein [Datura stramonium]